MSKIALLWCVILIIVEDIVIMIVKLDRSLIEEVHCVIALPRSAPTTWLLSTTVEIL